MVTTIYIGIIFVIITLLGGLYLEIKKYVKDVHGRI